MGYVVTQAKRGPCPQPAPSPEFPAHDERQRAGDSDSHGGRSLYDDQGALGSREGLDIPDMPARLQRKLYSPVWAQC